jgi:hypothetical protein
MKIIQQITAIMSEVGHIGKDRKNTQQNYNFRGVDDVYAGLQLVMAKHGVIAVPDVLEDRTEDRVTSKGTALIYRVLKIRYRFYADDGSAIDVVVIGEGMDSGDKASNKAMSVAHKYALLQVFMIPTSEPKDPENDSHDLAGKQTPEMQKKVKAMLEAFGTVAMSATEIEEVVGKPLTQIDEDDLAALRVLLATMRESRAKKAAEAM